MSQRNPQNDRYKEGGKKGVTRKSAGSAKPKSVAGSSVYYGSKKSAAKTREEKKKEREQRRAENNARLKEENAAAKVGMAKAEYRHYRNVWIVLIVLACLGVIVSFASPRVITQDSAFAALMPIRTQIQAAGLVVGYSTLIAAFVVDFRKMRPIRKGQQTQTRNLSKKERAHMEAREAAKANKKGLFNRKKQD